MTKKAAQTLTRILDHGLNMLSRFGFDGVTLGALAKDIGLSKSGLFAHFHSVDELRDRLLKHSTDHAQRVIVVPAMQVEAGEPRLRALVGNWLGWTQAAGLSGGCPVASGLFELDDAEGPTRDRIAELDQDWQGLLTSMISDAVALGHFRSDLDIEQMVWELCGIYLSHHASSRFSRNPRAKERALTALDALIVRAKPHH